MLRPHFRGLIAAVALGACAGETVAPPDVSNSDQSPEPALPALARTAESAGPFVSVFVRYRADAPRTRIAAFRAEGAAFAYDAEDDRVLALVMPRSRARALEDQPWVETVEVVDAPPFEVMGETVPWSIDSTGATTVHLARGNRGAGIRIGVLDTRVMCNHGDLAARIIGGNDLIDPTANICPTSWAFGYPTHGTAVAGIVAGSRNGTGIVGMAPEAGIHVLRVCGDDGKCEQARVYAGLKMAEKKALQVLNMSFGSCNSPDQVPDYVRDQIARLHQLGVVIVAAAGNGSLTAGCPAGGPINGLARLPGVIAVTHWRRDGTQDPAFQYGEGVDLAGPTNVPTASPSGVSMSLHPGTSFAAPHVAGAAALLISAGFTGPDLILRRLAETATDRGPAGWDDHWGWGTINVDRAAVAKPFIASFGGTGSISVAGQRTITAAILNGAPPIGVTWAVSYSDGAAPGYTATGGPSHELDVPAGRYTITVRATPRETVYGRVGLTSVVQIAVCATEGGGGGGIEPLAIGFGPILGGVQAAKAGGC
jgi:subtilisin